MQAVVSVYNRPESLAQQGPTDFIREFSRKTARLPQPDRVWSAFPFFC